MVAFVAIEHVLDFTMCQILDLGWTKWGRKMVKGYLNSCGITAGEKCIGRALSVVFPVYQLSPEEFQHYQANESFPLSCGLFRSQVALRPKLEIGNVWINRSQCM